MTLRPTAGRKRRPTAEAVTFPLGPPLRQRGQRQGHEDEPHQGLHERCRVDRGHQSRADEHQQIHRQQEHLREHQHRGRSEQPVAGPAGQAGEHNHVVDARRQQHQQHAHQQSLVPGDEPAQPKHHQRHHGEIEHQYGCHEPQVADGPPQGGERDPQERGIEQQAEHRIDGQFQGGCGERRQETRGAAGHDCGEIQADLVAFHPCHKPCRQQCHKRPDLHSLHRRRATTPRRIPVQQLAPLITTLRPHMTQGVAYVTSGP